MYVLVINDLNEDMEYSIPIFFIVTLATLTDVNEALKAKSSFHLLRAYMLGFPMGLVNVKSGLLICRMGCIARISAEQIQEDCNVLLDIQNFPGNSGSPVVNRAEGIAIEGTKALSRCVLIGIIHAYIPYQEQLVNVQTQNVVEIRSENSGIALMHPVEFIREVIDLFYKK